MYTYGPIRVKLDPIEPGPKNARDDSAILKNKAVVQPVAINAPIWSNGEYESQF